MRKDKVRTAHNQTRESLMHRSIKDARKNPGPKTVSAAFSSVDKAVKVNLIHRNKGSRVKSQLSKLLLPKSK